MECLSEGNEWSERMSGVRGAQNHEISGFVFVNPGGVRTVKNELRIENDVFFHGEFEFVSDSFPSFHLTPQKHVFQLKNTFFYPKW